MNLPNKDLIRIFSVTTIFLFGLWFLYLILPTLGLLAASLLIAVILNPLTNRLQAYMPKKSRALAVISTLVLILLVLTLLVVVVAKPFVAQFGSLYDSVTRAIEAAGQNSPLLETYDKIGAQVATAFDGNIASVTQRIISVIGSSVQGLIAALGSFFFYFFMIITLVFFMLFDSQKVIDSLGRFVPKKHQHLYRELSGHLFDIVARYFGGTLIVALIAGVLGFLALSILKIPYAVPLAVLIAVFDLIPMIGATLGGALVVIVTLMTGNVTGAAFMTIYLVIYQQIENNVVIPLVQKSTVKLSPLAVLVALLIGGAVGGIIGTLLAIPAAAFIRATYNILQQEGYIGEAKK